MKKVAVLLSGGIDSSLALFLLKEKGYSVSGYSLIFKPGSRCCAEENLIKAKQLCQKLNVPYHQIDVSDKFQDKVIEPFANGYFAGITPNPCLACNKYLKFGYFYDLMISNNFDFIASGHYARIVRIPDNNQYYIKKGIDQTKDQSYMLFYLPKKVLSRVIFPLGDWRKEDVIKVALENNIWGGNISESQDVCFIAGSLADFFMEKGLFLEKGPITDRKGKVLGEHRGLGLYTMGQREGLGIAFTEALYVIGKSIPQNTLIVGTREETYKKNIIITDLNLFVDTIDFFNKTVKAKIRYGIKEYEVQPKSITEKEMCLVFEEKLFSPTPGQGVVLYHDDLILGGGLIHSAW